MGGADGYKQIKYKQTQTCLEYKLCACYWLISLFGQVVIYPGRVFVKVWPVITMTFTTSNTYKKKQALITTTAGTAKTTTTVVTELTQNSEQGEV